MYYTVTKVCCDVFDIMIIKGQLCFCLLMALIFCLFYILGQHTVTQHSYRRRSYQPNIKGELGIREIKEERLEPQGT